MSEKYGRYVILRCGHPIRNEWTNLGVILYDEHGRQVASRMVRTLDRAIRRGDWPRDLPSDLHSRAEGLPDLESVDRMLDSMGHAMSSVQITAPMVTAICVPIGRHFESCVCED